MGFVFVAVPFSVKTSLFQNQTVLCVHRLQARLSKRLNFGNN